MRALVLTLAILPFPLLADPPPQALGPAMTAAEFDAYATGKTLSYATGTQIWGIEQYLSGRRVLWAPVGRPCEYGTWYDDNGAICFEYEADPGPNCWLFYLGPEGILAQFIGSDTFLSEVAQSEEPLNCPGPMIGA
jgi:hypothetical protein